MNRRAILNIVLASIVAVLAGISLIEPGKQEPEAPNKLSTLGKDEVHSIVINRTGEDDIVLTKNGEWSAEITLGKQRRQFRADTWKIDNILRLLDTRVSTVINNDDFQKYGLNAPRVSVNFNNTQIEYGNLNPLNQQRYFKVDNVIKLASDITYTHLLSVPTDYITRRVFPENISFREIKLPELHLTKNDDGNWKSSPEEAGSADTLHSLIDEWRFAQAISVQQMDAPANAQAIALTDLEGKQYNFLSFDKDGGFYLANTEAGIAYEFSAASKQRLFKPKPVENIQ